jgi:hypothetical protein
MNRKLPSDAFDHYVAMGDHRTYAAIAKQFGVSKRCVTKRAAKEEWTERLAKIQADKRVITDRQMSEGLAEMQERHMKIVRLMAGRALEGLKNNPIDNGMDAMRAADLAVKLERLLSGESTARTEKTIEEITRHEIRTLLKVVPAEPEPQLVEATVTGGDDDDVQTDEAE